MRSNKQQTFLSRNLSGILTRISGIIDLDYFKKYIGQTASIHLFIYVAGLILCGRNVTMTWISSILGVCRHDSLQRMITGMDLPMRILSGFFIRWIYGNRRKPGYLMIDDTVLDKKYSKVIDCAGFAYSSREDRCIMGIHIVVMYWSDDKIKIPVGFRLWIPEEKTKNYKTKVDLAIELLTHNDRFCKTCEYVTFDTWYCTNRVLRLLALMKLPCVSQLKTNRKIIFKGQQIKVSSFLCRFGQAELPGYGSVLLYRETSKHGTRYLISTDVHLTAKEVGKRYQSRWRIEECFRFMKQNLGLEACQCRRKTAVTNHISLVFLAHFTMEITANDMDLNTYGANLCIRNEFMGLNNKFPELMQRREFLKHVA